MRVKFLRNLMKATLDKNKYFMFINREIGASKLE